jgi:uncharacterized Zn-finger protein
MAKPPKREERLADLRCLDNGHRFKTRVPQVGHFVAEESYPTVWEIESIESVTCPFCGSRVEAV